MAVITLHRDHVQAVQTHKEVTAVAVATGHVAAQRRLAHVEVLTIRRGKSPLILEDLDPPPTSSSRPARRAHPTLSGEEP